MVPRMQQALLYWHTLRHLKASQLYWRLRYRVGDGRKRRYGAPQPLPATDAGARDRLFAFAKHWAAAAPPDAARAEAFLAGRFTFLNKTVQSTHPLWSGLDVPKLWNYHLHYFDFARDVALRYPDPDGPEAERVRGWMLDWVEKNTDYDAVAWDAFPLSARLMNWSLVLALYGWDDFQLRDSMHLQLDYLRQHLERDLRGNHLLKNAAALVVAGTLLDSAHRGPGLALLKAEVGSQMLADGGHIERSPMYHAQVLLDLLLVSAVSEPLSPWLAAAVERGLGFLHGVTHGDGRLAQFNDGAAGEGIAPGTLHALAAPFHGHVALPTGSMAYPNSGLYRLAPAAAAGLVLVKAGDATVNYQPGHAHSDLLSFEYSLDGRRILVNAGTHGYAGSPYRDYCRTTAAHNTVRINGQEQLEHWSTFRVARRVHARVRAWDEAVPALRASYRTFQGPRHERTVQWDPEGWWRIVDTVTGRGALSLESFLHLHPDCTAETLDSVEGGPVITAYRIVAGGTALILLAVGASDVAVVSGSEAPYQGWYFPRFGEAVPAPVLVLAAEGRDTVRLGVALVPGGADPGAAARDLARAVAGPSGRG